MSAFATSIEVTRSTATTASTLAGAAAAVAFAGLGALIVAMLATGGDDTRSRRTMLVATAFVLVATTIEFGAYLVEQVSLTAEAVTAVASSKRSLVVAARLLVVLALLLLFGRRDGVRAASRSGRAVFAIATSAALATILLDPVGAVLWRSLVAVGLGAGAAFVLHVRAVGPSVSAVATGVAAVGAVTIVLLGGVSDGWSVRAPTEAGTFDVSILPAEPGPSNEIHIIGQPAADQAPQDLLAVTIAGQGVQGPDADIAPGVPFELFLASPDHAIGYGIELQDGGPWTVDIEFRTQDGSVTVELEVERP
jgi:hypothetical protein